MLTDTQREILPVKAQVALDLAPVILPSELRKDIKYFAVELANTLLALNEARGVLKEIEWGCVDSVQEENCCPSCGHWKWQGHRKDCRLAKILEGG